MRRASRSRRAAPKSSPSRCAASTSPIARRKICSTSSIPKRWQILPNTAGCYTADEAIRTCRLAREVGVGEMVKLEIIGDQKTLFPDVPATIEAARILVKEGFTVLPYITDDPVACKRLEEIGCAAVMPLAAPIGSGLGIRNPVQHQDHHRAVEGAGHRRCGRRYRVGRGGRDGTRMRRRADEHGDRGREGSDRDGARDETRHRGGRLAFLAGRIERRLYATASSPITGLIG